MGMRSPTSGRQQGRAGSCGRRHGRSSRNASAASRGPSMRGRRPSHGTHRSPDRSLATPGGGASGPSQAPPSRHTRAPLEALVAIRASPRASAPSTTSASLTRRSPSRVPDVSSREGVTHPSTVSRSSSPLASI